MKNLSSLIRFKKTLIVLLTLTSIYSCKKDSSSSIKPATKTTQVAFSVKAINTTTPLAASTSRLAVNSVSTTSPALQFTSGIANITRFRLEARTAKSSIEVTTSNLMNVDLFAVTPATVMATLDTGTYSEIEVRVELSQTADTSAIPLKLKGTFTAPNGSVIPVEFDVNENVTIKAEAKNVVLHNTGDLATLVQLHLDKIVAGITASDLGGATLTNGVIVISSTSNASIFNKIKLNVENCGDTEVHQEGGDDNGNNGEGGSHGNDGSDHN